MHAHLVERVEVHFEKRLALLRRQLVVGQEMLPIVEKAGARLTPE